MTDLVVHDGPIFAFTMVRILRCFVRTHKTGDRNGDNSGAFGLPLRPGGAGNISTGMGLTQSSQSIIAPLLLGGRPPR
jgi:hypothetical protein